LNGFGSHSDWLQHSVATDLLANAVQCSCGINTPQSLRNNYIQTFRIGRSCIKLSTASADAATANWPLGLFLSEHTFAIILFGAIPRHKNWH